MHIPPYYQRSEWKRFFAGLAFGAIIGYLFFLFIHGQLQEQYTKEHIELSSKLNEVEDKYEALLKNQQNGSDTKPLSVTDIKVAYTNAKKLEVDLLTQHQLTSMVKDQLSSIPGKDLVTVASQSDLIVTTIENKNYVVDDLSYELKVSKLIISEVIQFELEIKILR
ncbi:sporulation membrane protein YtrI [Halobacillus mangrovi]|uniref:Sporulation membrane protein YtrI C-terminal domain-containing protein n=1 Tax=Halobacillus mangrovi TaxID=402384 RepID=A0A1W5ZU65_9BACI|nr:sporulation membrane protein YtrI [Halobacillus mangrovi]ARI76811.1 hypothetical protein HM131_08140 [Halobacillus mangrovi]